MQKCKKCNVYINTAVTKCPLCQNELEEDNSFGNFESNAFPYIESTKKSGLWQKVMGFMFIASVLICTFIDLLFNNTLTWSIYADLGILCLGASIAIGFEKKQSLAGILFYEYVFFCLIVYYWDKITGMHNWSLNYVLPLLSSLYIIANFVLRLVFKRDFMKYFRNILFASAVGIFAMFLYLNNISSKIIPPFVSCVIGGIAIISILLFDGARFFTELGKRLHI